MGVKKNKHHHLISATPSKIVTFYLVIIGYATPLLRLCCKHKKLKTLVSSIALHRLPEVAANPLGNDAELCSNIASIYRQQPLFNKITPILSILGLILIISKALHLRTCLKGFKFENTCTLYVFIYRNCYFVPIKITHTSGRLHQIKLHKALKIEQVTLNKHCLWDTLHFNWLDLKVTVCNRCMGLPTDVAVPLTYKFMLRRILDNREAQLYLLIKQGSAYYPLDPKHPGLQLGDTPSGRETV